LLDSLLQEKNVWCFHHVDFH